MKAFLYFWLFCFIATLSASQQVHWRSKIYVVEMRGEVFAVSDGKCAPSHASDLYSASNLSITTQKNAYQSVLYSNGVGMWVGSESHVVVENYSQEPFATPDYGLLREPSATTGSIFLKDGTIAVCTPALFGTSSISYRTNRALVNLHESKIMMVTDEGSTQIYVIDGFVSVKGIAPSGEILSPSYPVKTNRFATIENSGEVHVLETPNDRKEMLHRLVKEACKARLTLFFGAGAQAPYEIQPIPVVPDKKTNENVVSPNRLP